MRLVIILTVLLSFILLIPDTNKSITQKYASHFTATTVEQNNQLFVRFLGVSSLYISDGKHHILIDGFFSRPSLNRLLFSKIEPNQHRIKQALHNAGIKKLDAIITLHSHHDHAMDTPLISQLTNADIYGSSSTLNITKGFDIDFKKLHNLEQIETIQLGVFNIEVIPTQHTKMSPILSKLLGINEAIVEPLHTPTYFTNYKEGGSYALFINHPKQKIIISGSTEAVELKNRHKAQTIFLGIAKLGKKSEAFKEAYYNKMVKKTAVKKVIPIHWDNFTYSLEEPIQALPSLFDDFEKSMGFLIQKSQLNDTELILMDFYDTLYFN